MLCLSHTNIFDNKHTFTIRPEKNPHNLKGEENSTVGKSRKKNVVCFNLNCMHDFLATRHYNWAMSICFLSMQYYKADTGTFNQLNTLCDLCQLYCTITQTIQNRRRIRTIASTTHNTEEGNS